MQITAKSRRRSVGRLATGFATLAALALGTLTPAIASATDYVAPVEADSEWSSTISIDETVYEYGSTIDIQFETDDPDSTNWIGVYGPDWVPGSGAGTRPSAVWKYTSNETSGTVSLNLGGLDAGDWVIRYFADGGYREIAQHLTFSIGEAPTVGSTEMSLSAEAFMAGEQLTVTYQTDDPHPENWIGIYSRGEQPGPVPSIVWDYAPGTSGTLSFTLDLPPGDYDVWFLARGEWDKLVETPGAFTVSVPAGTPVPGDPTAPVNSTAVVTDIATDGVLLREGFDAGLPDGWSADFVGGETEAAAAATEGAAYAGWVVTDRETWRSSIDEMRHRFARTHGNFFVADAQQFGAADFEATLTSAPIDIEYLRSLRVTFDSHYRGADGQEATFAVRFDDGEWLEVLTLNAESVESGYDQRQMNAMQDVTIEVTPGASEAQLAWSFTADANARYWGIDSVTVYQGEQERSGASTNAWIVSDIQGHPHDFEHGLHDFNELMPNPAGLMMVGDIVNTGAEWEWNEIYEVMDNTVDFRPEVTIASIGNHERYAAGGFNANRDRFLAFAQRDRVYDEYVLQGPGGDLPVISIGQEFNAPSDVAMSDAQVEFLEERLAYWTAQGSQVIINTHFPLGNTVSASWIPGYSNHHQMNNRLTTILGNYPNAIIFTGHTHYPAEQGDWSMQRRTETGHPDGFWAISTIAMHNEWDAVGENTVGIREVVTRDINRGLTLESFGDRVVVKAYDFATDELLRVETIHNPLAAYPADVVPVEERPADYSAVDDALAAVPSDLELYTAESVAALLAAIDAVERGLMVPEQARVDGFAAAILDAIAALKLIGDTDTGDTDGTTTGGRDDLATTGVASSAGIALAASLLLVMGASLTLLRRRYHSAQR